MPKTVQISAEFIGLQSSLEKQIAAATRGQGLKIPLDTKNLLDFNNQLDRATQRVVTLGTAFSVLATANRGIRELVTSTVQVEKTLTSVNAIFRLTNENLNKFSSSLFDISRETATSFQEVGKAATEFARQGLSVVETQKAVRAALLLSRDANIDVEESVKAITSATNSFNKEALSRIQIVNRLASVDASFAVSSKDLAEALVRTGSAAADAGVNFNQFIGLVTAAQQVSQRGGSVIAGALNTIFTRINRKDTLEALDSLGVAITDVRGQALPTITVLQNFAAAYDKMTGSIKNQAAELVGGVRQLNTLKATLQDLSQGENSVFQQVQRVINQSSNEIERRNAARNTTLAALGSQASTTGGQIAHNVGDVGFASAAKPVLNFLVNNPITAALNEANGSAETAGGKAAETFLKGFGSAVVYGLAPIILRVLGEVTKQVGGNLVRDIAAVAGLNTEEQKRAAIEGEINAIYKAGGAALQTQLATMTSLTEQAAYLKTLLGGINGPGVSSSAIAGALFSQGYNPRRRTPGSAGGYLPFGEESNAIAAGVGGAPAGSRPVYLGGFRRPDGQGIVANSSEFIVPGAAGGYPAIYNRDMIQRMGLPPGSMPVAAGGYVPNAAGGLNPDYGKPSYYQNLSFGGTPPPPPLPASSVSASQLAADYERAVKEIAQAAKQEARLAKQKLVETEQILRDSADQTSTTKALSLTTKKALTLAEQRVKDYQAQQTLAREELTSAFALRRRQERSVEAGVAGLGPKTNYFAQFEAERNAREATLVGQRQLIANPEPLFAAAGLRQRQAAIRAQAAITNPAVASTATFDEFGPIGPQRPVQRSLYSRLSKSAGSLQGTLALGLGLPFLGGLIDDGAGGTTSGVVRGASQGALKGGGTGATIGSFFGPEGTLIGAGIGAGVGALLGGINKAAKSFEELSTELDQKTKKLNEELTNVNEIFRIDSDLKDAIAANNQEQVVSLKRQRNVNLSHVRDPRYRAIIDQFSGNPEGGSVAAAHLGNDIIGPQVIQSNLLQSLAKGETSTSNKIGQFFGGSQLGGLFNQEVSKNDQEGSASAIGNVIANLSPEQRKKLAVLSRTNFSQAIGQVAGLAGVNQSGILNIRDKVDNDTSYRETAQNALRRALIDRNLQETGSTKGIEDAVARERDLAQRSALLRRDAAFSSITGNANLSIQQTRDQIDLAAPDLTDDRRLSLQGRQGSARIASQAALQDSIQLRTGKATLLDIASKTGTNQNAFTAIEGINSLGGLQAFKSQLFDEKGEAKKTGQAQYPFLTDPKNGFVKALNDLENQMVENQKAQKENTRANDTNNQALRDQLEFLRTLGGAQAQDTGETLTLQRALEAAGTRRDSADVVLPLSSQLRSVNLRSQFRSGTIDQAQLDAGLFVGGLSDSLNQTTRTNRALGRPAVASARVGFGFDQAKADNDRKLIDNSVQLRTAKALGDEEKARDLIVEQNALIGERDRLLGRITQRQELILNDVDEQNAALEKSISLNQILLKVAQQRHDEESSIKDLEIKGQDLELEKQFRAGNISERDLRLGRLQNRATSTQSSQFTSGADISGAQFSVAQERGLQGDAQGSFSGGFTSVFAGAKRDVQQFAEVGAQVADSLKNSFAGAFGDFVTGTKRAKDAFRDFIVSVLAESARAFATKAIVSLLGTFLGGLGSTPDVSYAAGGVGKINHATGGYIGRAAGGSIPTKLTGGEFVFQPTQAARIGGRMLNGLNTGTARGFAPGGLVRGGSGVQDDVFQPLSAGSFVVRKAMVERYGANNLASLSIGGMPDDTSPMAALHLAGGGPVAAMMTSPTPIYGAPSGGGGGAFNIGVTINDNSTTTTSSANQGNGGSMADQNFGSLLARRVKETTLQVIQEQQRSGGVLYRPSLV